MAGLNVEDVDAIREWWDGEREGDTAGSMLGRLDAVVAEIAGRHVRAALTEAAAAIEDLRALAGPADLQWMQGAAEMRENAADLVRNLADSTSSPLTSP